MPAVSVNKDRLQTLDHLRGFFIVVIIIDHLSRWPSLFSIVTGKALLWVTAAEGFVAISGLLVGYVRGYKNRKLPMKDISIKLISRALLLYIWSLIGSIVYIAIIWYVPMQGGFPALPFERGDWTTVLPELISLKYTHLWVYFLSLYALFLAASPIAIWLMRRGLALVVALISFSLLVLGWQTHIESLQWQFLFFIPSIAGYYLPNIMSWWRSLRRQTRVGLAASAVVLTAATITVSVITTFYVNIDLVNVMFAKDTISLWRVGMAFLWFVGFILVFNFFRRFISRVFGWLLLPIGMNSLTAYILHGLAICAISFLTIGGSDFLVNTILGIVAVMIVWGLLEISLVRRIVPS